MFRSSIAVFATALLLLVQSLVVECGIRCGLHQFLMNHANPSSAMQAMEGMERCHHSALPDGRQPALNGSCCTQNCSFARDMVAAKQAGPDKALVFAGFATIRVLLSQGSVGKLPNTFALDRRGAFAAETPSILRI